MHTHAYEPEPSILMLMWQNQAYSCLWTRTRHNHAYVLEPCILMLMNQHQAYSCLCDRTKHTHTYLWQNLALPTTGDSFGKPNDSIVNKCMRYLCYEYFSTLEQNWISICGKELTIALRMLIPHYKSDSHNCGPYNICLITKCIL